MARLGTAVFRRAAGALAALARDLVSWRGGGDGTEGVATTPSRAGFTERLDDAFVYAHGLHRRQRKAKRTPYVGHLMAVAGTVIGWGGDEDTAVAALLHDAAEDHGGAARLDDIRRRFGARVAAIVSACTDPDDVDSLSWRERKAAHLEKLAAAEPAALLVSAADKLDNLRRLLTDLEAEGPSAWRRYRGGVEGRRRFYHDLGRAYARLGPDAPAVVEFGRAVRAYERLLADAPSGDVRA